MTRTELIAEIEDILEDMPARSEAIIKLLNEFCDELKETTDTINERLIEMDNSIRNAIEGLHK